MQLFFIHKKVIPENLSLKEKAQAILVESKFDQKRARTMDMDDFITYVIIQNISWQVFVLSSFLHLFYRLLHAFNKEGIHFA